jgi:hypothetical protein
MTRDRINRLSGILAVAMSLLALAIVLVAVTTGWERGLKDEGVAAHLFQFLVVGQLPFLVAFVATINRANVKRVIQTGVLEAAALTSALGCVVLFQL